MTPAFRHLLWTSALVTAAFLVLAAGQKQNDDWTFSLERALRTATEIASTAATASDDGLRARIGSQGGAGLRSVEVVVGRTLVADASGRSRALDVSSDHDKALYDAARRLHARALAQSATGPTAAPFELGRSGAQVVAVVPLGRDSTIGVVRVVLEPFSSADGLPWLLLVVLVGAWVAGGRLRSPGAGVAVLALHSLVSGVMCVRWTTDFLNRAELAALGGDVIRGRRSSLFVALEQAREASAWPFGAEVMTGVAAWTIVLALISIGAYMLGVTGRLHRFWRALVEHRLAYGYLAPAMLGLALLSFVPLVFGLALGFMERTHNVFDFVGLANYVEILGDTDIWKPGNFYGRFLVTVLWTVTNVLLHVSIGLGLALLLNDPILKAKGLYRVLLVVPWAVPNYITALLWKGLFHRQFGAVNAFLTWVGVDPVAWFQSFWPAFTANVATNTWLGFPFMMVVSLGALQSIPTDLYDAAYVDGASRWQRFKHVTWPLLLPALVPAVINGVVWTFNMFNVIYLVSGGAPDGRTDILITEAFRWAFERDRYGLAAAYSTLVFAILLLFTLATNRFTNATKAAQE